MALIKPKCLLMLIVVLLVGVASQAMAAPQTAFYYGAHPPMRALSAFDWVVLDPDNVKNPQALNHNSKAIAYISVGETLENLHPVPESWVLTHNKNWNSVVIDQSQQAWHQRLLQRMSRYHQQGYQGFFLDTLDAYQLAGLSKSKQQQQRRALIRFIKTIRADFPRAIIIVNRGFKLIPQIHNRINAVVVESLYRSFDEKKHHYTSVSAQDSAWLILQLNAIKKYHLPIIIIDYVAPNKTRQQVLDAQNISRHGFIPWVTNRLINRMGVGLRRVYPRTVILLYDAKLSPDVTESNAFRFLAMPLEYLGYTPKLIDINGLLPEYELNGRVAGIALWLTNSKTKALNHLDPWLLKQVKHHVPLAIFGQWPFLPRSKKSSLLAMHWNETAKPAQKIHFSKVLPSLGFEIKPYLRRFEFFPLRCQQCEVLLQVNSLRGQLMDAIAYTQWGGYALGQYSVLELPNSESRWVINPFSFLRKALQLKSMPVADVTTQNGRRLLMTHIDGDGFISQAEWPGGPIAGMAMLEHIIQPIHLPITVSVITGELHNASIPLGKQQHYDDVAKKIFNLPWVEVATHTYSHPYDWYNVIHSKIPSRYHLPIKGYTFNLKQEIQGSVKFINSQLAPANKKTKVVLWSGLANPTQAALKQVKLAGLWNMNGGNTDITNDKPSITHVSPLGLYKGQYFQVFAPQMNENIYTNLWNGPFWGFQRVIETFKRTNTPRRLKPMDIYYHFYSASKKAALSALTKVYAFALKQNTYPLWVSEYTAIVKDYESANVSKQNNYWRLVTTGQLREWRIPVDLGYPDLRHSKNIIGFSPVAHGYYYVHTGANTVSELHLQANKPHQAYVVSSNAKILHFSRTANDLMLELKGRVNINFTLANVRQCILFENGRKLKPIKHSNTFSHFQVDTHSASIAVRC